MKKTHTSLHWKKIKLFQTHILSTEKNLMQRCSSELCSSALLNILYSEARFWHVAGLIEGRPRRLRNSVCSWSVYRVLRSAELQRSLEQRCIRFCSVLKIWVCNNFIFFQCKEVWVFFIIKIIFYQKIWWGSCLASPQRGYGPGLEIVCHLESCITINIV